MVTIEGFSSSDSKQAPNKRLITQINTQTNYSRVEEHVQLSIERTTIDEIGNNPNFLHSFQHNNISSKDSSRDEDDK